MSEPHDDVLDAQAYAFQAVLHSRWRRIHAPGVGDNDGFWELDLPRPRAREQVLEEFAAYDQGARP